MQLTPRYGSDPLILLDGPPSAVLEPVVRQRRRLVDTLGRFDSDQWEQPTRCDGWTAREVVVHLDTTNSFWSFSIRAGLAGSPSTFLADFDPVATPVALVDAVEDPPEVVLERFAGSTELLVDQLGVLEDAEWNVLRRLHRGT